MTEAIFKDIIQILGPKGFLGGPEAKLWQKDWLNNVGEAPLCILRPDSTQKVVECINFCSNNDLEVVIRGGNTSLVGGSVLGKPGGVILSLDRMNRISHLDNLSGFIEVESGVLLKQLHDYLDDQSWIFPMHLGSEGSAHIGGLIGTNAGGSHAFRFGMMQDLVLGMEVVLPNGEIWNGLRCVQKDNSGYQLRKLFCGAEGTLGVVTRAILKLSPKPLKRETFLLCLESVDLAVQVSSKLRRELGDFISALEFFSDTGLDLLIKNIPNRSIPIGIRAPFYLLAEIETQCLEINLMEIFTNLILSLQNKHLILDGIHASSENKRKQLWKLREEQPEGQRLEGIQIKNDISVPPSKIPDFLNQCIKKCESILPGIRINPFGHLGDGNIHLNLSPPEKYTDFQKKDLELVETIADLVENMSGSFAAEHGLGRFKINMAQKLRSKTERELMKSIYNSINSKRILNQGIILD